MSRGGSRPAWPTTASGPRTRPSQSAPCRRLRCGRLADGRPSSCRCHLALARRACRCAGTMQRSRRTTRNTFRRRRHGACPVTQVQRSGTAGLLTARACWLAAGGTRPPLQLPASAGPTPFSCRGDELCRPPHRGFPLPCSQAEPHHAQRRRHRRATRVCQVARTGQGRQAVGAGGWVAARRKGRQQATTAPVPASQACPGRAAQGARCRPPTDRYSACWARCCRLRLAGDWAAPASEA